MLCTMCELVFWKMDRWWERKGEILVTFANEFCKIMMPIKLLRKMVVGWAVERWGWVSAQVVLLNGGYPRRTASRTYACGGNGEWSERAVTSFSIVLYHFLITGGGKALIQKSGLPPFRRIKILLAPVPSFKEDWQVPVPVCLNPPP